MLGGNPKPATDQNTAKATSFLESFPLPVCSRSRVQSAALLLVASTVAPTRRGLSHPTLPEPARGDFGARCTATLAAMLRELSLKAKARRRSSSREPELADDVDASAAANSSGDGFTTTGATSLRTLRASLKAGATSTFSTAPKPSDPSLAPRAPRTGGLAALRTSGAVGASGPKPPSMAAGGGKDSPPKTTASRGVVGKEAPVDAPISIHVPLRDGPPKRAPGLTYPLLSVNELLAWRPTGALARCVSRTPLPQSAVARYTRSGAGAAGAGPTASASAPASASSVKRIQPPRLLLCHDFAHGYPEWEASADGVSGEDCPVDQGMWRFNHWAYVDIFVYFSHHRVTIPPVGYIHAAHRHGALALGTLIFENADGLADLKQILASFRLRSKAATQLATVAKFFGFDGWLVNVEVSLASHQLAGELAAFVADLTRSTRKLVGAASEVIWYDAITRSGELKWQNELNVENESYFKAAGAIFTNYHWDRSAPVRSAVKAGPRRTDVFTGIDVHGRNTFGGGGFQTHLALRPIKQSGTSAAIFAPSWTVERCPPNVVNPLELEERFWTGPRGKFGRESIAHYFKERAVVTELPFSTSFDPGWGPRTFKNGLVVDERRYFNMSRQDVQPSFMRTHVASGDPAGASLSMSSEVALQGSTSVQVTFGFSQSRMMSGTYSVLRLFVANVPLAAAIPRSASSRADSRFGGMSESTLATSSTPAQKQRPMSLRVAYDYYVQSETPEAADSFGMVLMLNSPATAILLVSENSKWATDIPGSAIGGSKLGGTVVPTEEPMAEGSVISATGGARHMKASVRLQVLGKFVTCHVVTPTREHVVQGPPASDPGKWYTRVFDLPPSLVVGQRLAEVMVVVGEPPVQPQSVSPSPFATPGGSRLQSRLGSRLGSRDVSRYGSRPESRQGSRTTSRRGSRPVSRQGSRPGSRSGSPPRADDLLASADQMGADRSYGSMSFSNQRSSSALSRRISVRADKNEADGTGREHCNGTEARQRPAAMRRDGSYRDAFAVQGVVDFSQMDEEEDSVNWSANASRAMSRLSSRLGTPSGSRSGSRIHSRLTSRRGSTANSLAVSRAGSRAGSRLASPSGTPLSGGSGALPLLASALSGSGMRSGMATPNGRMSSAPSRLSVAPLRDLKSALINAAGSLAGMGATAEGTEGGVSRVTYCVYLGSVRMEMFEVSDAGSRRRESAGFDNDFFNTGDALMGAAAPLRSGGSSGFSQRRLSRRHLV